VLTGGLKMPMADGGSTSLLRLPECTVRLRSVTFDLLVLADRSSWPAARQFPADAAAARASSIITASCRTCSSCSAIRVIGRKRCSVK